MEGMPLLFQPFLKGIVPVIVLSEALLFPAGWNGDSRPHPTVITITAEKFPIYCLVKSAA